MKMFPQQLVPILNPILLRTSTQRTSMYANLLTEIFRDTHASPAATSLSSPPLLLSRLMYLLTSQCTSTCTRGPIKAEFTEGEAPHISPLTRARKPGEASGPSRQKKMERRRKGRRREGEKGVRACVKGQLEATNERARRSKRDRLGRPRGSRHRQIGPTYFRPRSICSFDVKPVVGIRPRTRNSYETPKEPFPPPPRL